MSLFSFKPEARSLLSKIGKPRLFLFFGAIVVLILGNTLAANISLNSGGNVEFGQGVALTTACDNDVTVTPYSTFINEDGAGDFMFTSISVTGISEDCDGKIFTIKAYEEGSDDPLDLYITGGTDTYDSVQVSYSMSGDEGAFTLVDAGLLSDDIYDRERDDGSDSDGFSVDLFTSDIPSSEALASARDVDRITIESRDGEEEVVELASCTTLDGSNCTVSTTFMGGTGYSYDYFGQTVTIPENGQVVAITDVYAYLCLLPGPTEGTFGIYDSIDKNTTYQSFNFTLYKEEVESCGATFLGETELTPINVAKGQTIYIEFHVPNNQGAFFTSSAGLASYTFGQMYVGNSADNMLPLQELIPGTNGDLPLTLKMIVS